MHLFERSVIKYMAGKYEVVLGIGLDKTQLRNVEQSIENITKKSKDREVIIDIDFNIKDASKLVEVSKKIKELKSEASAKNAKIAMPIDAKGIENSLDKIHKSLLKLRDAFGKVDSNKGTKSLLTSVRDIGRALDGVNKQISDLNRNLGSLASRDFSLNFDFGLNNSKNKPTEQLDREIKLLEKQAKEYERYLSKVYLKGNRKNADGVSILFGQAGIQQSALTDLLGRIQSKDPSRQINAYKEYIRLIREAAAITDVTLTPAELKLSTSGVTESLDKIENESKDTEQKLRELFSGGIDSGKLHQDITRIADDLNKIQQIISKISEGNSFGGLTQSFNRLSETLEQLMINAKSVQDVLDNNIAATGMSKQEKQARETAKAVREVGNEAKKLNSVSIDISDGSINDLKAALKNLKVDDDSIEKATKELNEMNFAAKNVSATFKDGKLAKIDVEGVETTVDGLKRATTVSTTFGEKVVSSSRKSSQALDEVAIAAEKVNKKLTSGGKGRTNFDVEINDVEKKFNSLSIESIELRNNIALLKQEFANIQAASASGDLERLVAANERYNKVLKDVNNQLKLNQQAEKEAAVAQKLIDDRTTFQNKIDAWLKKNSAAVKKFGADMLDLKAKAESCDRTTLDHLEREFKQVDKAAEAAGKKAMSVGDRLKTQFAKYSSYLSAASAFMYIEQGLRSMFEQVVAIDSAMTELMKVTNETSATYDEFLTNASERASEIGTTIDGLVQSTAGFARLGYEFSEAVNLAEVANIYAVVGDEIDSVETATQSLISTMAAFGDEVDAMSVIDKFNEIGKLIA